MKNEIRQKELSIISVILYAIKFTKDKFSSVLAVLFIIYLPIYIGLRFFIYDLKLYSIILNLADLFIGILSIISISFIVEGFFNNKNYKFSKVLAYTFKKWLPAFSTYLLTYIIIIAALPVLVVPGLICTVFFSFSVFTAILRNKIGFSALKYSWKTVKGSFLKVALFKLFSLIPMILNTFMVFLLAKHGLFVLYSHMTSIFICILNELFILFFGICEIVLFINLDFVKNNTLDLQPVLSYDKPKYPEKDNASTCTDFLSPIPSKWKVIKYGSVLAILIAFSIACWNENKYKQKIVETLMHKQNSPDIDFTITGYRTSGLAPLPPEYYHALSIEESSNLFFTANDKNLEKAYWIINSISDYELRCKIESYLQIFKCYGLG